MADHAGQNFRQCAGVLKFPGLDPIRVVALKMVLYDDDLKMVVSFQVAISILKGCKSSTIKFAQGITKYCCSLYIHATTTYARKVSRVSYF